MVSSSSQAGTVPGDEVGGKERERQRKAKREKDVGYSLNSLFVSVIYTSKIVPGGKGLTNSFFPPRSAATHPAHLGCIMKAKVRLLLLLFLYFWACQILQSSLCRCNDGPFQSYPCIYTQICLQDLSQVQHWPPAGLAPYPSLLNSTTTKTHTHTHKPSAPLLEGPADPHLIPIHGGGGGVLI